MAHPIDKSMALLSLSQNMLDHSRANPDGPEAQQMAQPQPQTAPQTPQEQPQPTQPEPKSNPQPSGTGGLEEAGNKIVSAFQQITDVVKNNEQSQMEMVKTLEEKHTQELKGLKDTIKSVIEG